MPCARCLSSSTASCASALIASSCSRQRPVLDVRLGEAQPHLNHHQPLLRAVMEVSLQSTALAIGGRDDPRPRCSQLIDQPGVVEQHQRRGGQPLDDVGVGVECRVVDQRRERLSVSRDLRDPAQVVIVRQLDRRTVDVDVAGALRCPEGESQRPVLQCVADQRLDRRRRHRFSAPGDGDLPQPNRGEHVSPHLSGEHRKRNAQGGQAIDDPERVSGSRKRGGQEQREHEDGQRRSRARAPAGPSRGQRSRPEDRHVWKISMAIPSAPIVNVMSDIVSSAVASSG